MNRETVKLALDLRIFDETPFLPILNRCLHKGYQFTSIEDVGDTETHRLKLYELNKTCSADIPARGEFFSFEEFAARRFGKSYDPSGVFIALDQDVWIGMAATSNHSSKGFAFNEMTGVLREFRKSGIAISLKVLGIRYAKSLGVEWVYTIHDAENVAAIAMNRRLGYRDAD